MNEPYQVPRLSLEETLRAIPEIRLPAELERVELFVRKIAAGVIPREKGLIMFQALGAVKSKQQLARLTPDEVWDMCVVVLDKLSLFAKRQVEVGRIRRVQGGKINDNCRCIVYACGPRCVSLSVHYAMEHQARIARYGWPLPLAADMEPKVPTRSVTRMELVEAGRCRLLTDVVLAGKSGTMRCSRLVAAWLKNGRKEDMEALYKWLSTDYPGLRNFVCNYIETYPDNLHG